MKCEHIVCCGNCTKYQSCVTDCGHDRNIFECKLCSPGGKGIMDTYKCAACGGVFEKTISEEEAQAELKENFGDIPINECDIVCDVCYQKIMKVEEVTKRCVKIFIKLGEEIKKSTERFTKFIEALKYERKLKAKELAFYESIAGDKSNNWRKYHGLATIRTKG